MWFSLARARAGESSLRGAIPNTPRLVPDPLPWASWAPCAASGPRRRRGRGFRVTAAAGIGDMHARTVTMPHARTGVARPGCWDGPQGRRGRDPPIMDTQPHPHAMHCKVGGSGARGARRTGALDRLCKLDKERHCKRTVHGTDCLGGKGCTRMRPKLHLPVPVLGHAFRITGFLA